MSIKTLSRTLLWVGLIGFCSSSTWAQGSTAGTIVLSRVQGVVEVTDRATGTRTAAVNGQRISQGYLVTTGREGRVILVFSNGSTVNLGAESILDVETFLQDPFEDELRVADLTDEPSTSTTTLNLTRGELVGSVKKLNTAGGSSFTVQTPAGAAGIRGTTFRIVYRPSDDGRAFYTMTLLEGSMNFAAAGVVDQPVVVADLQEIVIDVTVNETTGEVTVTVPTEGIATTTASAADQATIAAAVQEIAEAVAETVMAAAATPATAPPADEDTPPADTPPADTPPADTPPAQTPPPQTPPAQTPPAQTPPPPPPPVVAPPKTTPGDGRG